MDSIFFQLAGILALASFFGFFVLKLRLPLMVGYLLTGVAMALFSAPESSVLHTLPEIGIAFVLFLVGMEMDWSEIRILGKPIVISSLFQILVSGAVGIAVAYAAGFVGPEALFIGIGLAFSSTVVIVKMLLEKRDESSLYGKLSVGMLIIEDIVAILVLMAVSLSASGLDIASGNVVPLLTFLGKAASLVIVAFVLERYVLERLMNAAARSTELLFFTAVTWCFVFTAFAVWLGFSIVIGAFIAGVTLASSPYQLQIHGKIKPLRDFFVALFFVYLGFQVNTESLIDAWPLILVFAGLALTLKPIAYLIALSFFGFRKHTLFQSALNMSQVSEFSLIILLVGVEAGVVSEFGLTVMAGASIVSIIVSSTLIARSDSLLEFFSPFIARIQRAEGVIEQSIIEEKKYTNHVVVVGANRIGRSIVNHLKREDIPTIVLDYNPALVLELRNEGLRVIYGDLSDPEILNHLQLETAKLVISTVSSFSDSEALLGACKRKRSPARIVVTASELSSEPELMALGADYVIVPERVSGDYIVTQLRNTWPAVAFQHME